MSIRLIGGDCREVLATLPAKFESKWGKGLWERIAAA